MKQETMERAKRHYEISTILAETEEGYKIGKILDYLYSELQREKLSLLQKVRECAPGKSHVGGGEEDGWNWCRESFIKNINEIETTHKS
jgi:hypothetical protein